MRVARRRLLSQHHDLDLVLEPLHVFQVLAASVESPLYFLVRRIVGEELLEQPLPQLRVKLFAQRREIVGGEADSGEPFQGRRFEPMYESAGLVGDRQPETADVVPPLRRAVAQIEISSSSSPKTSGSARAKTTV